jgi:cation-transporting P-type ATPase E
MMLDRPSAVVGLDQAAVHARVQAGLRQHGAAHAGPDGGPGSARQHAHRFNAILAAMFVVVLAVGPVQDALFGIVLVVNTGFGVVMSWSLADGDDCRLTECRLVN